MAKMKIETGVHNPILRAVSTEVKIFDKKLQKFVKDMKSAMKKANGLGLAAPQIGHNTRVFLMILDYEAKTQKVVAVVNPQIISKSIETEIEEEGCLSIPGVYKKVERHKTIEVTFKDENGINYNMKLSDLNAREFQHEYDHLYGILFVDKVW